MEIAGGESYALVAVGSRPHPKSLFGQLLVIGTLPLSISTEEGDSRTRRKHTAISKHISDRELRRLQLPSLLSALLPPAAPLEDQGEGSDSSSSSEALPVQQQALVVRGAASLVLQQWLLLAADALQLLRRLLQPEKQHQHRRSSNSSITEHHHLLGRQHQQDSRRKRVRTAEVHREDDREEQQEDADEAAEAIWERTAAAGYVHVTLLVRLQQLQLQQQQQQGEEESQQRLKRLGSVFATHLQEAESSVRANRDSAGMLLQRGAPDLFSACWAAVATPLRSGGPRPGQQQQQQIGSHERLLAGDAHAPGMSWRRWAFGGPEPHIPLSSAAAASSAATATAVGKSISAAAAELEGDREEEAGVESADFVDMWGPLPEEEQQDDYERQQHQQQQQQQQHEDAAEAAQGICAGPKTARRRQGHGVQLDTNISRRMARNTSSERAFPSLLSNRRTTLTRLPLCNAAKYVAASTTEVYELYAAHPVANLYEWLQQQLLLSGGKPAWSLFHTPAAAAVAGRNAVAGRPLNKLSSESGSMYAAAAANTNEAQQHSTGRGGLWPRQDWEGDFTLYTEADLQQQQQQQQQPESSSGRRRSRDLMGSGEYVEVLRGIFDSSSMQQRATQTRLTQMPRESEASSTSRLGSSRRASGISAPSSEASLEALAYGDFPDFEVCPSEFGDEQQQHQQEWQQQQQQRNHLDAHGTAVASLRLRQLLQEYALTHPDVSGHLFGVGTSSAQQLPQHQQQNEYTIPLSRLLPRGLVDPRTACCTFSHLLLLHRHGSIRLEQQEQALTMPSSKPYPELFVHVTQEWRRADEAAGAQQPEDELQQQQGNEKEQQTHPHEQGEQMQHEQQQPQESPSGVRQASTPSENKQHDEGEQRQQQKQVPKTGASKATGLTLGVARSRKAARAP